MQQPFDLTGKTILVTGASSGIGKRIAVILAEANADLIISGRNSANLDSTLTELKQGNHQTQICDLLEEYDRENFINKLPKLDGVVYCAGALDIKPVKYLETDDIRYHNSINYEAPVMLIQGIIEHRLLNRGSSIVLISSISADNGAIGFAAYAGSKGALNSFSRVLALELAPQKIRVNCIAPGMVKTPMFDKTSDVLSEETLSDNEKQYPLGFIEPDDVAYAVQYLLSNTSTKITGTILTIDGGFGIS